MTIKGFTKADNSILFNSNLRNNAKLVYMQIKYYSNLEGFRLSKALILKDSQLSVNTFDKVIKELKDAGLVIQNVAKDGKKNIYWYITTEAEDKYKATQQIEGQITVEKALEQVTGGKEKIEAVKQSRQTKIDNHKNVRLVRSIVDIDKSNIDKEILSMADETLVRNVVNIFKGKSFKKTKKRFFTAKTIRNLLVEEYYNNKMDFPAIMLKKLNANVKNGEIPIEQYSEINRIREERETSEEYFERINRELGIAL